VIGKKIAEAMYVTLHPKGFNFLSNIGEVAGQTVFHVHLHIIPRYDKDDITITFHENTSEKDFDYLFTSITKALS
jgi:histidine triad (HIT) family protein